MEVCHSPGDFVLDSDPAPLPKRGQSPPIFQIFGPCLLWTNGWMDQDGTWRGGKAQPRRLCVKWGPRTLSKKGAELPSPSPQFSVHFYYSQMAGCIKMPLDMEVGLKPGDFVLHGDPAPSPKRGGARFPENFGPCLFCPSAVWI